MHVQRTYSYIVQLGTATCVLLEDLRVLRPRLFTRPTSNQACLQPQWRPRRGELHLAAGQERSTAAGQERPVLGGQEQLFRRGQSQQPHSGGQEDPPWKSRTCSIKPDQRVTGPGKRPLSNLSNKFFISLQCSCVLRFTFIWTRAAK